MNRKYRYIFKPLDDAAILQDFRVTFTGDLDRNDITLTVTGATITVDYKDYPVSFTTEPFGVCIATTDIIPPAPSGNAISGIYIRTRQFGVSVSNGTDNITPTNQIIYRYYYSTSNNITTVQECLTNGTHAGDGIGTSSTHFISGLTPNTTYWVNVVLEALAILKLQGTGTLPFDEYSTHKLKGQKEETWFEKAVLPT